jgi:hypothetical protein
LAKTDKIDLIGVTTIYCSSLLIVFNYTSSIHWFLDMRAFAVVAGLLGAASAKVVAPAQPQHVLSNPPVHNDDFRIPTWRESVAMARKIMRLTNIGDLVTVFPQERKQDDVDVLENRPSAVAGSPIGLMEYYADCDVPSGNPIFLSLSVATPYRNYYAGSNISLSIRWWPQREMTYSMWSDEDEDYGLSTPHTPVALPRMSLHGHLEVVSQEKMEEHVIPDCFIRAHVSVDLFAASRSFAIIRFTDERLCSLILHGGSRETLYTGQPISSWWWIMYTGWEDLEIGRGSAGCRWTSGAISRWKRSWLRSCRVRRNENRRAGGEIGCRIEVDVTINDLTI